MTIMIIETVMSKILNACNFLAEQNIYVFRMGVKLIKNLSANSKL